jgi:ABC-type nitrate/sulfonate/bicarbonate transport system ATPase subunit
VRDSKPKPKTTNPDQKTSKRPGIESSNAQIGVGKIVPRPGKDSEIAPKTSSPPVVEFKNVTKTYNAGKPNAFTAIKDISFVVSDKPGVGEFVGVLGPSGCGKSTILKLIAGLEPQHPPTSGVVAFLGKSVFGPGADRGMVFQDYTSFDHRTVLDNITFGLECHGVPRKIRDEMGRHWIEQVGLDVKGDQNKYPHELSGGMRQRVAIARSLILRPRVILMDEPFGALDPQTRLNMQDLLVDLWRKVQASVFFVTHSIEEAVYLGDRVFVLSSSPGTLAREIEVESPDRPAAEMQREQRFQDTVYYIRDLIAAEEA